MAATEASAALIRRDVARTDANFLICCRLPDLLPDLLSPAARAGRRLPHMAKRCARGAHGCGARSTAQADAVAGADV